jgi:hypothetical protein
MAEASISIKPDTEHLAKVLECIAKHARACAEELRELDAANSS